MSDCSTEEHANNLLSENDALREVLKGAVPVETECGGIVFVNPNSKINQLKAENAKLRAVIESEIHCWKGSCNGCVAYRPAEDGWCDQQVWLEELGIEGHL